MPVGLISTPLSCLQCGTSKSKRLRLGTKEAKSGEDCELAFLIRSPATARNRISISAKTSCCVVTTTAWKLQGVFQSPSTCTTSWRQKGSAFHRNGGHTSVAQNCERSATFS